MDLVADDDGIVGGGEGGQSLQGVPGMDGPGGVVRMAEQDCAGSRRESRLDTGEVDLRPVLSLDERDPFHHSAGLDHRIEEGRVHRRHDDHAVTRPGDLTEDLDGSHHHIAGGAHEGRIRMPPEAPPRESGVCVADTRSRRGVAGVPEFDRATEPRRDRRGEGEIGFRNEERQHVGGVRPPFRTGSLPQIGQRKGFEGLHPRRQIAKPRARIMSRPSSVMRSGPHGGIHTQLMRNRSTTSSNA